MKRIFKIVSVFVGLIIGAGFASGREVLEYFNYKSSTSIFGVVIASLLFTLVCYTILSRASQECIGNFNDYIGSVTGRLAPFVKLFMFIFMFCGLFVMFSGSGALVYTLTPLSSFVGALLMAIICFGALSFDLKGIVAVNILLVPLMIAGIIYVSVCTAIFGDELAFSPSEYFNNEAMLSAVCYTAYNTITAGAVLVPLAGGTDKKTVIHSAVIGGFVVGLLIAVVWAVQGMNFSIIWNSELPMLELASLCGKTCKKIYTAVLFMAICTTAVSHGFGIMSYFSGKIKSVSQRVLLSATLCLVALPFSSFGFSTLVAKLYSFFGYVGMLWMAWIIINNLCRERR